MEELYLEGEWLVLKDDEIKQEDRVKIYESNDPSFTIDGKTPIVEITGDNLQFKPMTLDQRMYYIYTFADKEKKIATRLLPLDGTFNCRDLGGYKGAEGKRVKWGQLFRSDALNKLSNRDIAFLEGIGIKTIVDFRGDGEWQAAKDKPIKGAEFVNLSPNAHTAALASGNIVDDRKKIESLVQMAQSEEGVKELNQRLDEMALQMREIVHGEYSNKQYKKLMKLLSDETSAPLLQHCKGGKDRTGFGAMLMLLALGVSIEDIEYDYMLTKQYMAARNEKRMDEYRQFTDDKVVLEYLSGLMQTKMIYIEAAWDEMKKLSGNIPTYLKEHIGVTEADMRKLQEMYLYY